MTLLIGICIVTLEGICGYLLFQAFLTPRRKNWYWPVLYILLSDAISAVFMTYFEDTFFKFVIAVCMWFVTSCLFFRGRGMERLFAATIYFVLRYGLSYGVIFMLEQAGGAEIPDFLNPFPAMPANPAWMLLAGGISRGLLLGCVLLVRHILSNKSAPYHYAWWEWTYVFLFPITAFAIYVVFFNDVYILSRGQRAYIVIAWGLVLTSLLELYLMERGVKHRQLRKDHLLASQRNAIQQESLAVVTEAFARQRQMTHDFQNHLQLLEQLLASHAPDRARSYLQTLLRTSADNSLPVHTDHAVLDAILNYKYVTARRQEIAMEITACNCGAIPVADDDLVTILSNALDNAIEACQKLDRDRQIHVKLSQTKTEWIISVRNTAPATSASVHTHRRDPILHGYGLGNIRGALAHYDSDFAVGQEGGWFQLTAVFRKSCAVSPP